MHPKPECLRVLIAEDEPMLGECLTRLLQSWGHEVVLAGNGCTGWCEAAHRRFDFLITDHRMPKMDGLALFMRLREDAFNGHVVVHSSNLPADAVAGYRRLGVRTFLVKPVSAATWAQVLTGGLRS